MKKLLWILSVAVVISFCSVSLMANGNRNSGMSVSVEKPQKTHKKPPKPKKPPKAKKPPKPKTPKKPHGHKPPPKPPKPGKH
jgi:hypothetical protein